MALPLDHPLVDLDTVDLNLLDDQPFIMFSPDAARYFHDLLTNAFDAAQILPKIVHQVGQMHSMLALVDVGFGAALVPQSAERLRFKNVVFRPLSSTVLTEAKLHLIWQGDNENPVLEQFIDGLQS